MENAWYVISVYLLSSQDTLICSFPKTDSFIFNALVTLKFFIIHKIDQLKPEAYHAFGNISSYSLILLFTVQGSLTTPEKASDKPGPGTYPVSRVGRRWGQRQSWRSTILEQHQGRNQQPWDELKYGPGQSAGTVKLNGVPQALQHLGT